jgi:hypothetical protein
MIIEYRPDNHNYKNEKKEDKRIHDHYYYCDCNFCLIDFKDTAYCKKCGDITDWRCDCMCKWIVDFVY